MSQLQLVFSTYFPDCITKLEMERLPHTPKDADELLRLSDLLREVAVIIKDEWAKEDFSYQDDNKDSSRILPSHKLWNAERTVEAVTGSLVELVAEPHQRIQQILAEFMESRALFIAAERRIPDILNGAGPGGLDIQSVAEKTGIERRKLGELSRTTIVLHVLNFVSAHLENLVFHSCLPRGCGKSVRQQPYL